MLLSKASKVAVEFGSMYEENEIVPLFLTLELEPYAPPFSRING